MVKLSQRPTPAHKHNFSHKLTPNIITVQRFTLMHRHEMVQQINHELSHNHALKTETEPDFLEQLEPKESDDDWNEDYGKPPDEYETGDAPTSQVIEATEYLDIPANLEQASIEHFTGHHDKLEHAFQSIDFYRIHGYLPNDADPQLHEDLAALENSLSYQKLPKAYPTFDVIVEDDRVEANVVPVGANLRYVRGFGPYSTRAKNFIKLIFERNRLLNDLAYYLLEIVQRDFFLQHDLDAALGFLLPVSTNDLATLRINTPFKLDKKYLSKLGDHLVKCHFGIFPLNFFLQKKAQLLRIWIQFAIREGIVIKKEQLEWIRTQIKNRVKNWEVSDIRQKFISPLVGITINDIKYARRIYKQSLSTSKN